MRLDGTSLGIAHFVRLKLMRVSVCVARERLSRKPAPP